MVESSRAQTDVVLTLYFTVGPETDSSEKNDVLHVKSFDYLLKRLDEEGLNFFGVADASISPDYLALPFELCRLNFVDEVSSEECRLYPVAFHALNEFELETVKKLRDFVIETYVEVCGKEVKFVKAEVCKFFTYHTTESVALGD